MPAACPLTPSTPRFKVVGTIVEESAQKTGVGTPVVYSIEPTIWPKLLMPTACPELCPFKLNLVGRVVVKESAQYTGVSTPL
jgi:hypothetical protein